MTLNKNAILVMLVFALLCAPASARANDFSFGGSGTSLIPHKETRIRMVSEDIDASFYGSLWSISATYVFENPTDHDVMLTVGFPEPRCIEDVDCSIEDGFLGLRTTLDGRRVQQRRAEKWLGDEYPALGAVWVFVAVFPANSRTTIAHDYRVKGGEGYPGVRSLSYITRTGSLWNGPIERARFRFQMPATIRWYEQAEHMPTTRPRWARNENGNPVSSDVVFEFENWTPTHDLWISFVEESALGMPEEKWRARRKEQGLPFVPAGYSTQPGVVYANAQPLPQDDESIIRRAMDRGLDDVRVSLNWMTASYGRRFQNDRLNRFFYGEAGFVPPAGPPYLAFEPNPEFTPAVMQPDDRMRYDLLHEAERRLMAAENPAHPPAPVPSLPTPPSPR